MLFHKREAWIVSLRTCLARNSASFWPPSFASPASDRPYEATSGQGSNGSSGLKRGAPTIPLGLNSECIGAHRWSGHRVC